MDGASKFIRGDAIAGILITIVNIIGGILIGVVQQGMLFTDALQTYTVLTIGDGLVIPDPPRVISGAAGLLISRVPGEEEERLPDLIADQLFGRASTYVPVGRFVGFCNNSRFASSVPDHRWCLGLMAFNQNKMINWL